METALSQEFKDSLQEIFRHFGKQQRDKINLAELILTLNETKVEYEEDQVREFFELADEDHDDYISFDEFCEWFASQAAYDASTQSRIQNFLEKMRKESHISSSSSSSSTSSEDISDPLDSHYACLKIGDPFKPKMSLGIKLFAGEETDKMFQEAAKNLSFKGNFGIILSIQVKAPSKAEESAKSMISRLLDWVSNFLPHDSGLDLKQIKFQTAIDGSTLKIGFDIENKLLIQLMEDYTIAQSRLIPDGFNANVSLEIDIMKDFNMIFEEVLDEFNEQPSKKNLLTEILEGLSVTLKAQVTRGMLEKLRDDYLNSKDFSKLPDRIRNLAFLLLWKSTKIELAFRKIKGSFLESMLPKKVDLNLPTILKDIKEALNLVEKKHLILKSLFLMLNKEFESDFVLTIRAPRLLATVEAKVKGIKEIYDYLSK